MIFKHSSTWCAWFTGILFLAAGLPKILDPAGFAKAVYNYQLLPDVLINVTAIFLPWLEVLAGMALLVSRRLRDAASGILLALLILFSLAIAIDLYRGIDIACGCFSVSEDAAKIGWSKVAMNLAFIAIAATAWAGSGREPPLTAAS